MATNDPNGRQRNHDGSGPKPLTGRSQQPGGRRPLSFTLAFLGTEAGAGAVLATTALIAIILANSPFAADYFAFVNQPFRLTFGPFDHTDTVLEWTKEGLMTIFFFIVGLEIKYEALRGELSNRRKLAMPVIAAIGGMVLPALVFLAVNAAPGGEPRAWAVPVATDIAFALGALAVLGRKLPPSLRVFLLTLAIADDLGAVILIAVLFTSELALLPLTGALLCLAVLVVLSRYRQAGPLIYGIGLLIVWALVFESGVSPAIAGVATALTVPVHTLPDEELSPAREYMDSMHPYVAFGILPFFAFVAAGFSVQGLRIGDLLSPLPLGIVLGLTLGKTLGVFGAAWLAVKSGLAARPAGATWGQVLTISAFCGIGFTMSLFIGGLTFPASEALLRSETQLGVIAGTLLSLIVGGVLAATIGRPVTSRQAAR